MKADYILLTKGFKKIIDDDCYVLYKNQNKFIEIEKEKMILRIYKGSRLNPIVLSKEISKVVHLKMQELGKNE